MGACFVCFGRGQTVPATAGEPGFAAAVLALDGIVEHRAVAPCGAGAPYEPGLLALREGLALASALETLPRRPEVLVVNATGRDHPRRAGLALHLGAVLELPSVGVTHRPLEAAGVEPARERGAKSPLHLEDELVGFWLRTRVGRRPLAVHAGWRTDPDTAVAVVLRCTGHLRTPEPLREARSLARSARAAHSSSPD